MSRTTNSNSRSAKAGFNKVVPKPFCPHCKNLGMSEAVYTSHFVRANADPTSKVVCPELLATECTYCFMSGHTKSRCPIVIAEEAQRKKEEKKKLYAENLQKKRVAEEKQEPKKAKQLFSKFAALIDSDSDEEQPVKANKKQKNKQVVVEQFPALPSKPKVVPTPNAQPTNSYAFVASSQKKEEVLKKPKLTRSQASGYSTTPIPNNTFWDGFNSEKEDETEFALRKHEEESSFEEERRQKLFSLKASEISWENDSDDEDW